MRGRIVTRIGVLTLMAVLAACNAEKKPVQSAAATSSAASSQNSASAASANAAAAGTTMDLAGTEWQLVDLGGAGVVVNSKASVVFLEGGKVAGNGSCNRFTGTVAISGTALKFSPLASTMMACTSEPVSQQEMKYLRALQNATRYEWKDPYLLVYCDGLEQPLKFARATTEGTSTAINLVGTEWHLEDLGGAGVIDNSQASLAFPEAGRIGGNGSCNRFMGTATIEGGSIKIKPLGTTRMACPEAVGNQENKYLKALEGATRYEWKDPYLLIYSEGMEQPLKFTKAQGK
jgi:heat shock protein HslJ